MAVSYEELDAWPKERIAVPRIFGGEGGMTARRLLKCAWDDRWTLASEHIFTQFPYVSTSPPCVCLSIDMEPLEHGPGQTAYGIADYEYAQVMLHYAIAHITAGGLVITENIAFGYTGIPLNPNEFQWEDSDLALSDQDHVSVDLPYLVYECTVHNATAVPAAAVTLINTTNNAPMAAYTYGITFDTGCLWYRAPRISNVITYGATTKFAVTYNLLGRGVPWNKFFRPSDVSFQWIESRATGSVVYPLPAADLTQLFA